MPCAAEMKCLAWLRVLFGRELRNFRLVNLLRIQRIWGLFLLLSKVPQSKFLQYVSSDFFNLFRLLKMVLRALSTDAYEKGQSAAINFSHFSILFPHST